MPLRALLEGAEFDASFAFCAADLRFRLFLFFDLEGDFDGVGCGCGGGGGDGRTIFDQFILAVLLDEEVM